MLTGLVTHQDFWLCYSCPICLSAGIPELKERFIKVFDIIIIVRVQYLTLLMLCILTLLGYRSVMESGSPVHPDGGKLLIDVPNPVVVVEGCGKREVYRSNVVELSGFDCGSINVTVYSGGRIVFRADIRVP